MSSATTDLDQLLCELGAGRGGWKKQNENRRTIAQELGVDVATFTSRIKSSKTQMRDAIRSERAVEAIDRLPAEGEYIHVVTGQEFAGFDLLGAILNLSGQKYFRALTMTTLGFSKPNLAGLVQMINKNQVKPATLQILCSDFFRRSDKEIWKTGAGQAKEFGYGFRSTRNHTKLILADVGRRYVVESSANLRSCANLEQFTMTQSKQLYEFHIGWISKVWEVAEA